jgi:hypothetical protein
VGGNEGFVARARRDTSEAAHSVKFILATATLDAVLAGAGAVIASAARASTSTKIEAAVAGALGGTVIALLSVFVIRLVLAPFRQRDEALDELGKATPTPADDPATFIGKYSDWLLGVKAALPDPDTARTLDYFYVPLSDEHREQQQAEIASASRVYRQTYDEEERKARIEYHKTYRAGVLTIVGEGHERAHNPYSIKDLEAVEKLLLAAKPVSPEAAEFKHFAQQFAGWLKSYQPEAFDPAEWLGEDYVERQGIKLVHDEITKAQYDNLVQPFIERREWEQRLRSDYQLNKRADVLRWLSWAKEMGGWTGADLVALMTAKEPRTPEEFKELVDAFDRIAGRL